MKLNRRILLLSSALLFSTSHLAFSTVAAHAATPADTLVIAKSTDDIISLDPAEVFEISGGEVINNVYTRLVTFDPSDFTKLVGGVAESWTISDDGKTYTFKIRPGLKFHSGRPVTAEDVAFSLQRVIKLNKTPAFILSQFGWDKDNVDNRVTATDGDTVQLQISEALAPTLVLNVLTAGVASVVDKAEVLAHEKDGDLGYNWLKTNSAGSGAYKVLVWQPKEAVVLQANPDFYRGKPGLDKVIVRNIGETATQALLLEKGDVDIARDLRPDQISAFAGKPDFVISGEPKQTQFYLGLNQKNTALANPKVREAIRHLVDYDGIVQNLLKGQYIVHQSFIGKGTFGALEENPFTYDVAKAKALLAEAGYPNGLTLEFDVANTSPYTDIAQSLQNTFKQAGITLNLIQGDKKQVAAKYRARNHDITLWHWSPDYLDPHSSADFFARNPDNSDNSNNKTLLPWRNAWEIPEITAQTDAAVRISDTEARKQAYLDLQRKLQQESPYVLLFQNVEQTVSGKDVKGFVSGPTFDTPVYAGVTKGN